MKGFRSLTLWLFMLLAACSSAGKTRLQAYFQAVAPYEQLLGEVQTELTRIAGLHQSERRQAYEQMALGLEERAAQLKQLEVPREAARYHTGLSELLELGRAFMRNAASAIDADQETTARLASERQALSERWSSGVTLLKAEQAALAQKHGLQFE
ncbi:MAG: hypothetical protein HY319_25645 [Armatimonadetes bacterium]|nr:hypothetical protein [Armatimonadota bacterium]